MLLSDELKRFREAGREEGREEGRREGREEGNKEGRKEEHISVIETMIAEGFSDDQIIRDCQEFCVFSLAHHILL